LRGTLNLIWVVSCFEWGFSQFLQVNSEIVYGHYWLF
jgi:hypothetical protein